MVWIRSSMLSHTEWSVLNHFATGGCSQWQNISSSSGCKDSECIGLLRGCERCCWASCKFQLHLASWRKALAWACGCQAPPEVTLSEPVKPEINHSHPSKAALHRHCDWAIWASAHCLHLSLWTIRQSVWLFVCVCVCVSANELKVIKWKLLRRTILARNVPSFECRRERWNTLASVMQACYFTPVHILPLHEYAPHYHLLNCFSCVEVLLLWPQIG